MPSDCISFQNSGYFSSLINDYLDQKPNVQPLYHRFPTLENFGPQIEEKKANFDDSKRAILVAVLEAQYAKINASTATLNNIKLLNHSNTYTITTGHQLNLFSGPLYFLYKIISTINLTKELQQQYPEQNFVPVYWMATEDHDFEEINYFTFKGKKFCWNRESSGPVGRLSTEGLEEFLAVFALELGNSTNAEKLKTLFHEAYLKHTNLADATRYLANALFGDYGLVILDADDANLKRQFIPFIKEELLKQTAFSKVNETIEQFGNYTVQVNPREINLFFIEDNLRERIIFEDGGYKINNTKRHFSEQELLAELELHPEKFSPNVVMRPLYQEVILPNLAYIGGGGEIAYWLELKSFFETVKVTFPMLIVRNSVVLATEKQLKKANALALTWSDLFQKQTLLINNKTKQLSEFDIDLSDLKQQLQQQFQALNELTYKTDRSFAGAVKAQEVKQTKGLEQLEKRLLKAQKRKLADSLSRITALQNELFPNQSLQERQANFSEFYLENGEQLLPKLVNEIKPLSTNFTIITF